MCNGHVRKKVIFWQLKKWLKHIVGGPFLDEVVQVAENDDAVIWEFVLDVIIDQHAGFSPAHLFIAVVRPVDDAVATAFEVVVDGIEWLAVESEVKD